jgi:hypothetical protein
MDAKAGAAGPRHGCLGPAAFFVACFEWLCNNASMILQGHFENGVVVLDSGTPLPDGTPVTVSEKPDHSHLFRYHPGPRIRYEPKPSAIAGTLSNTPEEIAEMAYSDELPS